MARTRLAPLLALASVLVALAGCGGGSEPAPSFNKAYVATQTRYKSVGVAIVTTLKNAPTTSDRDLSTLFDGQAAQLSELRSKLAGLEPPGRAEGAYRTYLATLRTAADDLRRLSVAAGASDPEVAADLTKRLLDDLSRGQDARLALERAAGITTTPSGVPKVG